MKRLQLMFPWLFFGALAAVSVFTTLGTSQAPERGAGRLLDPVCSMDVHAGWGHHATHGSETFYFCAARCVEVFRKDPAKFLAVRCMVCQMPLGQKEGLRVTYLGKTYNVCGERHRADFKADPAAFFMHRMWGIPDWLYYVSIALVMLVSFVSFESLSEETRSAAGPRIDLMRSKWIAAPLRSRRFRFAMQFLFAIAFGAIIGAGLFGDQNPARNIAPLLTWTVWWGGLVVLIMFAGKAWCYVCPWDAMASWAERLHPWAKTESGGLQLPWPRSLRNILIATLLFVGLTWVELGFGVTMKPAMTAYLALGMLVLAVVSAFLFERRSFCRYGCLVGRVSGLYAMFSSIEIRSRDADACASCRTKECVKGSDTAYGCPTFQYPGGLDTNTYCIQCAECLQACPKDNLSVNLRPWGADLANPTRPRRDEAYLALLMLAISGFHGLTMTPVWAEMTGALPGGRIVAFSLAMAGLMLAPIVVYALLVRLSHAIARRWAPADAGRVPFADYFVRYAYCVLPIALFYHLAHNLEHLLMEGPKVAALASDPFGWGWNLFGTAGWNVPPLISLESLWFVQVVLVGIGHVYSLWAASRISRRVFRDRTAATASQWPLLLGMIAFSVFSLWLLKQPMEMRSSVM